MSSNDGFNLTNADPEELPSSLSGLTARKATTYKRKPKPQPLRWPWVVLVAGFCLMVIGASVGYFVSGHAVLGPIAGVTIWAGFLMIYSIFTLYPVFVARRREHPNRGGILACVVVSFFIPIFWIAAIIWAYSGGKNN